VYFVVKFFTTRDTKKTQSSQRNIYFMALYSVNDLTIIMTHDIERQLSTLKPAGHPELAQKILAIPHRRRQRRRDCFVGLTGLLTGIAATVLVMLSLQTADGRRQTAANDLAGTPVLATAEERLRFSRPERIETATDGLDPIDIDAWNARYEILLRHRPTLAYQPVVYAPVSMPGGVSPLEYRNRLLEEYMM
jgi:hypothetical protein